jgi:hypothetical protein
MTELTVYLMPVSFGYGPSALAVAVARAVRHRHPYLRVAAVADGLAWELLAGSGVFPNGHVIEAPAGELPIALTSNQDATWVGFADFDRLHRTVRLGLRSIMVDPLWWMWDEPPALLREGLRYLALRFPGIEQSAPQGVDGNFRVVPQVVETGIGGSAAADRSGVLLNLGGGVVPGVDSLAFLQAVVDVVSASCADTDLLVASSAEVVARLSVPTWSGNVALRNLSRLKMIRELTERAMLLTVPGQSIIWEALAAGIPTIVVPGSNYSQHRQSVYYREELRNVPLFGWDDLPGYELAPAGLPEEQGLRHAAQCGRKFAGDGSARALMRTWLCAALRAPRSAPSVSEGSVWSDLSGADVVADEIAAAAAAVLGAPQKPATA